MDENEPIYENIERIKPHEKTSFDGFPWKNRTRNRQGNLKFNRCRSASEADRRPQNTAPNVPNSKNTPLNSQQAIDDSCAVGYCSTPADSDYRASYGLDLIELNKCTQFQSNRVESTGTEVDAEEICGHADDTERRRKFFSTAIPLDILAGIRNGNQIRDTHLPKTDFNTETERDTTLSYEQYDARSVLYKFLQSRSAFTEPSNASTNGSLEAVNSGLAPQSKLSSVAVCEVKPTVRDGAEGFKRQRNKAIRRASSVAKKTVTFKLDKTDEFADPPSPTCLRKLTDIITLPKPESGIMKNTSSQSNEPDATFEQKPDEILRESQLSPLGTSSDSGRDSFLSCCSECTCSGPSHFECEQCAVLYGKNDNGFAKPTKEPLRYIEDERVVCTPAFIVSKLEDSIYQARSRRSWNTPKRLEPGVTARSAEYLNIDVANSILRESQKNSFATFKTTDQSYAKIKGVDDVSLSDESPKVPPREKLSNEKKCEGNDQTLKNRSMVGQRPSKSDLLLLNKFHSYTLSDIMDNYSSLLDDITKDSDPNKRQISSASIGISALLNTLSVGLSNECYPVNPKHVSDALANLKSVNSTCLSTQNPKKSEISHKSTKDQSLGDKGQYRGGVFGAKQKPFLMEHKQRSQSETAFLKNTTMRMTNQRDHQVFGNRKSVIREQWLRNDPAANNSRITHGNAPSNQTDHGSAPPRSSSPETYRRSQTADIPRLMNDKRQIYTDRLKSWSCFPGDFKDGPLQCSSARESPVTPFANAPLTLFNNPARPEHIPRAQSEPPVMTTTPTQPVEQLRNVSVSRTPSPYCQRQFPDVRWVASQKQTQQKSAPKTHPPANPLHRSTGNLADKSRSTLTSTQVYNSMANMLNNNNHVFGNPLSSSTSQPFIQWTKSEMAEIFC